MRNQVLEQEGKFSDGLSGAELREARMQAIRRQLPHAQVVIATCVGSGMDALDVGGSYDLLVVDEASQALEPATLVALERAGIGSSFSWRSNLIVQRSKSHEEDIFARNRKPVFILSQVKT